MFSKHDQTVASVPGHTTAIAFCGHGPRLEQGATPGRREDPLPSPRPHHRRRAPEPYLKACLEVLYRATVVGRLLGWNGEKEGLTSRESDQLADLMDAVHNIPHLVQRWEDCNEALLRTTLKDHDDRWASGLLNAYMRALGEDPDA